MRATIWIARMAGSNRTSESNYEKVTFVIRCSCDKRLFATIGGRAGRQRRTD